MPQVKAQSCLTVVVASFILAMPVVAVGQPARCVIRNGPGLSKVSYSGDCLFFPDKNGTFSIRKSDGNILPSITNVSVYVLTPGVAEVRGLTVQGINSRWGPAKRSEVDPACWTGSDFEVCAY